MGRTRKHQSGMILDRFPTLKSDGYKKTSDATTQYNCVAWAADDIQNWWDPDKIGILYWPSSEAARIRNSGRWPTWLAD